MAYNVRIVWKKEAGEIYADNKYSRAHTWIFDCGIHLQASSSPHIVPVPMSVENAVDPEEAFIASVSSCHMLWFLSIAAGKKLVVRSYDDNAEGILAKNGEGKTAMTEINLKPEVVFEGINIPSYKEKRELHQQAHSKCFIANSIKTKINIIVK